MIAKVLASFPAERLSFLTGIGVPSNVPASWRDLVNCRPRELHQGEIVSFDFHRNGQGEIHIKNIRILTGNAEKRALGSPALNPAFSRNR